MFGFEVRGKIRRGAADDRDPVQVAEQRQLSVQKLQSEVRNAVFKAEKLAAEFSKAA